MKTSIYTSFKRDFNKMIDKTPGVHEVIDAYEKGLLTYTEALRTITDRYIQYTIEQATQAE